MSTPEKISQDPDTPAPLKPDFSLHVGYRALMSIIIVLFHFFTFWSPPGVNIKKPSYYNYPEIPVIGLSAVSIFFALSGMMAAYTSYNKFETISCRASSEYILKRFARLSPVYYMSLLIGISFLFAPRFMKDSLWQLTIIVPGIWFKNPKLILWNAPLWYVCQLMLLFFTVPALMFVFRRINSQMVIVTIGLLGWIVPLVTFFVTLHFHPLSCEKQTDTKIFQTFLSQNPGINFFHFISGFAVGIYMRKFRAIKSFPEIVDACTAIFFTFIIVGGILTKQNRTLYFKVNYWDRYLAFPFYLSWAYFMTTENGKSYTAYLFANPVSKKIGEISYAIYCVHTPIFNIWQNVKLWKLTIVGRTGSLDYWEIIPLLLIIIVVSWGMTWIDSIIAPKLRAYLLSYLPPENKEDNEFLARAAV